MILRKKAIKGENNPVLRIEVNFGNDEERLVRMFLSSRGAIGGQIFGGETASHINLEDIYRFYGKISSIDDFINFSEKIRKEILLLLE